MAHLCITGTGYFGASRQRVKQLSSMLGLRYSGELSCGITEVLVVADDPNTPSAELLAGQKAKTAALWGNILIVRHQWLEDSAQRGALCDPAHYTLLPQKEVPVTGTQAATCTDEQSGLQTELEGPKGDHNAWSPFTFADTPEALRKIDRDVPFTALEDLVASGLLGDEKVSEAVQAFHIQISALASEHDDVTSAQLAGSPALSRSCPSRGPGGMQHDQASFPDRLRAYTMDLSSAFAQTGQSSLADTSELTQHLGSSALLPQPLQLLCGDTSKCTPPATAVAGDSASKVSPQAVKVRAEHKLKRPPKQSTAASFHGAPASSIAYYDTLTVEHPELDSPLEFCTHDPSHCALVHYEDSRDGETRDLAYAQILHCYRLAKDDRIYIEHRYLYDADDIRQQRAGSAFLEQHSMADLELVLSPDVYHSLAEVIDGEFWLAERVMAERKGNEPCDLGAEASQLCLFCEHSWDRLTGSLLPLVT